MRKVFLVLVVLSLALTIGCSSRTASGPADKPTESASARATAATLQPEKAVKESPIAGPEDSPGKVAAKSAGEETSGKKFDLAAELAKKLKIKKKSGIEGLEQDREIARLMMSISVLRNFDTALQMYKTDFKKYPKSLEQLKPEYMVTFPKCRSKKGESLPVYKVTKNGKEFELYCKGAMFSHLNVPSNYPRYLFDKGVYLKPGVPAPKRPLSRRKKALMLFSEGMSELPMILQNRDPKKARRARLKLEEALKTGELRPNDIKLAKKLIKEFKKIEKGQK